MRCTECLNGDLGGDRRHKSAERNGRIAVVTGVPVTVCPSCETVWFDESVAVTLDALLTSMLATYTIAVRPFSSPRPSDTR